MVDHFALLFFFFNSAAKSKEKYLKRCAMQKIMP
uniref:Uncharacterized protein n=1 Tax=Arundo donax TaxID=35708 RepID=A0A0A9H9Z9_ARUDO